MPVVCAGCAPQSKKKHHASEQDAAKPEGTITGTKWHIPWLMRNPKHPQGPFITTLVADAEQGAMTDEADNISLRLGKVHALMYREGKPSAIIVADQMTTDKKSKIIVGTGHVKITSILDPPDTVITADKVVWDTHTSIAVATGHAKIVQTPTKKNGGPPIKKLGPRFTLDFTNRSKLNLLEN